MEKILLVCFNLLVIAVVIACQSVEQSQSPDNLMLKPGDEIDGMILTTGAANAPPFWAFCSPAQTNQHVTKTQCHFPAILSKIAIGQVFSNVTEIPTKLDWLEFTWKLLVDEYPIDLASFGTYDFAMPSILTSPSPVREVFKTFIAWDVVLTNLKPGEHTVYGLAQSETDSYTWIANVIVEAP